MSTLKQHVNHRWIILSLMLFLIGCSQTILVTKQGNQFSNDNISFEQFNRSRERKYFEMRLNDSTVFPILLIRTGNDSIVFEHGENHIQQSLPIESISALLYRQNDNGFNSMIGAFIGLIVSSIAAKSMFDFNDNTSSIKGFVIVTGGTVIGVSIGYCNETTIEYLFKTDSTTKR